MKSYFVRFFNIVMAGLVAGIVLGISLGYNPINLSATTYVEQHQNAIASLNTLMPILGAITILLTLVSAYQQKRNKPVFIALLIAVAFLTTSGLVTKLGNQPINSIVMEYQLDKIPTDWGTLRDKWWSLHLIRTATSIIGFLIILWAGIRKD
ncbi:MAG: DUF1772 domain-containing protein [Saprospiraceae bacterium]|jgi:hypothetical protein